MPPKRVAKNGYDLLMRSRWLAVFIATVAVNAFGQNVSEADAKAYQGVLPPPRWREVLLPE
jgi:hypothetical protein